MAGAKPLQLLVNFPDPSKNKSQGNVMIVGAWGYSKNPMLWDLEINLDLEPSWAPEYGFLLCCPPFPVALYFVCLLLVKISRKAT